MPKSGNWETRKRTLFIAVFNNMRTLKFKPQLTVYVFRCRQSSKRTSRETKAHFSRIKRSRLSVVIGRFRSILFVSGFQGSLAVAIIMIDSSEKPNCQLGFELQSSHVIENRNNSLEKSFKLLMWNLPLPLHLLCGQPLSSSHYPFPKSYCFINRVSTL